MTKRPEEAVGLMLKKKGLSLSTAESLTGGLLGHKITNVPGSSGWFNGGVVAYTDEVKKRILGVGAATLKEYGPVSSRAAKEMAIGVRKKLKSDIGLALTGIAGPGGAAWLKPVGTVFIAITDGKKVYTKKFLFKGGRKVIKEKAATLALMLLERLLKVKREYGKFRKKATSH